MKIVFIQKSTGRGGAKNSLAESLAAIRRDGSLDVRVLAGGPGPFVDRCQTLGVRCDLVDLPEWRKFFDRLRFSKAMRIAADSIRDAAPNWVISNEMWWAPHAARIARHLGCRSAVILRDGIATVPKARQYRLFDNDLILPVSSTIAYGLSSDPAMAFKTHVLFNPVSLPDTEDRSSELDAQLSRFPLVKRWLLVIGRVCSRKKQADAVQVLRRLVDDGHDDLGLILAGDMDADYEGELRAAISASATHDRVVLLGNFDDIPSLFSRAHTVLLTSTREGLPRSLVESLLVPVPAFSYPCEGVTDIYGPDLPVFVSGESTPESLHRLIRKAWEYPDATAAVVKDLHQRTLARFAPDAHLRNLLALLNG